MEIRGEGQIVRPSRSSESPFRTRPELGLLGNESATKSPEGEEDVKGHCGCAVAEIPRAAGLIDVTSSKLDPVEFNALTLRGELAGPRRNRKVSFQLAFLIERTRNKTK